MKTPTKIVLTTFSIGILIVGLSIEHLSQQEKNSIASIERQEVGGHLSSTQATMEKDSIRRDHIFKF